MLVDFRDVIKGRENPWPNFTPWELRGDREDAVRDNFQCLIDETFLDRLQEIRAEVGFPFIIASYFRSGAYNNLHSGTGLTGPHTTGRAVDISVYGDRAYGLISFARMLGFTGIGVKQHGPREGRFIHLDDLPEGPGRPRPWLWSYT